MKSKVKKVLGGKIWRSVPLEPSMYIYCLKTRVLNQEFINSEENNCIFISSDLFWKLNISFNYECEQQTYSSVSTNRSLILSYLTTVSDILKDSLNGSQL